MYLAAFSTNSHLTQRGGLRWMQFFPPKSPNIFFIFGDKTLIGLPALS